MSEGSRTADNRSGSAAHHHSRSCVLCDADKQTFPQQDVVGWYATGVEVTDHHMHIQRKVGAGCRPGDSDPASWASHSLRPFPALPRRHAEHVHCMVLLPASSWR